ncbi:hypothetical protein FQR65_LT06786 [Abscondita terminalis]|nr:hypothetical protein FQR65_LT06786 [Abscondita terminalis]
MELNNIITVKPANYYFDSRGLGRMYYDCMLRNGNKVALVDGLTGNSFTYKTLLQRSVRTSIALQKNNLQPGDVIIVFSFNHLDCTTILIGSLFSNLTVAGIEHSSPLNHVIAILDQIRPKIVFASKQTLQTLTEAIDQLSLITKIVMIDTNETDYDGFESFTEPSLKKIHFNLGTTGLPKGVSRSHLSLMYCHHNVMNSGFCWDVFLNFSMPLWSVYMNYLSVAIFLGKKYVIYPNFSPEYAWEYEKHKVTSMFLGVWDVIYMCNYGGFKSVNPKYLKQLILGGSVLSQSKMGIINNVFSGVPVCNTYGQTETGVIFMVTCMFVGVWYVIGMCHYGGLKSVNPKYLKQLILGGSVLSESKMDIINKVFSGVSVCNSYGQTETGAMFIVSPSDYKKIKMLGKGTDCVGKGLPGITYKVGKPILNANFKRI